MWGWDGRVKAYCSHFPTSEPEGEGQSHQGSGDGGKRGVCWKYKHTETGVHSGSCTVV